jgi:hypothetical protein
LEALWERNKATRQWAASKELEEGMKEVQSIPNKLRRPYRMHSFARREDLRGLGLVEYLILLERSWRDKRFGDCINALYEHEIVNPQTHVFTDRQGPEIDAFNQRQQDECLAQVRSLMDQGIMEKTACARVAAEWGIPANSFAAAVEQLRYLIRQSSGKHRTSKRSSGK